MTSRKTCFKCGVEQPITEFYRHAMMADGHLNKCKACTKRDVAEHRSKNIEKVREYDRERAKRQERIAFQLVITRNWRAEDRRRSRCHSAVARAIKSGKLVRQPCEKCGAVSVHAHHEDYDKPLDVRWFCAEHHSSHHHH